MEAYPEAILRGENSMTTIHIAAHYGDISKLKAVCTDYITRHTHENINRSMGRALSEIMSSSMKKKKSTSLIALTENEKVLKSSSKPR